MANFKELTPGEQIQSLFDVTFIEELSVYKLLAADPGSKVHGVRQDLMPAPVILSRIAAFLLEQQAVGTHMFFAGSTLEKLRQEINKVPAIQQFVLSLTSRFIAKLHLHSLYSDWATAMGNIYRHHQQTYTGTDDFLDSAVSASIATPRNSEDFYLKANAFILVSYMLALLPMDLIVSGVKAN